MKYQKVIKHGNSLAVVIPAPVCREMAIRRGDQVKLKLLSQGLGTMGASRLYLEIWPVVDTAERMVKEQHGRAD